LRGLGGPGGCTVLHLLFQMSKDELGATDVAASTRT
jgi:hypothetical protein